MADDLVDESHFRPPPIGLAQFCLLRDALECAQDYPIMADVLGLMLSTTDYEVLATISDTLHYHSLVFAAIGALVPLLSQLTERYSALRAEKLPGKPFLRAYIDLCTNVRVDPQLLQLLKYELYRIEQQSTVGVCSPASDNMAESLQSAIMDTDDDFERILVSGSTMDEQMMARMFKRLVSRLGQESAKETCLPAMIVSWFPRLRAFDEKTFDRLVQDWISGIILEQQVPILRLAVPTLVVSACFSLEGLADCSTKLLPVLARRHLDTATVMSREILAAVLPSDRLNHLCQPAVSE
jgi:mediator of RNA polymerase II transcription subunit 12, fungi type